MSNVIERAPMTREGLTQKIVNARLEKGLSWKEIAQACGMSTIYCTAALLGQMKMEPEAAAVAASMLDLSEAETRLLTTVPYRGSLGEAVPTDPLIYRFYELIQVYGTTLKAVIEEDFGDGIMSAIDFEMDIERVEDPKGDRVRIVLNGKFLPYKRY